MPGRVTPPEDDCEGCPGAGAGREICGGLFIGGVCGIGAGRETGAEGADRGGALGLETEGLPPLGDEAGRETPPPGAPPWPLEGGEAGLPPRVTCAFAVMEYDNSGSEAVATQK